MEERSEAIGLKGLDYESNNTRKKRLANRGGVGFLGNASDASDADGQILEYR